MIARMIDPVLATVHQQLTAPPTVETFGTVDGAVWSLAVDSGRSLDHRSDWSCNSRLLGLDETAMETEYERSMSEVTISIVSSSALEWRTHAA